MHICVITRLTLTHGIRGGMERHASILMQRLQGRGHRLTLITTAKPPSVTKEQESAQRIWYLSHTEPARYTSNWWRDSFDAITRLNQQDPIDVIWSQSVAGLGYLERIRPGIPVLPFVIIMHGTAAGELRARFQTLTRSPSLRNAALVIFYLSHRLANPRRWKAVMDKITALIAVSPAVAEDLRTYLKAPQEKVHCVTNGIDIHRFSPNVALRTQARDVLSVSNSVPLLMTAGRLSQDKGIQLVIAALAKFPHVHLAILGSGSYERHLHTLSETLGVASRVHFLGMVPYRAMATYLNGADIFLYPSLREEAFPLSIIEAMATGIPVIASDVGGIPTAIQHGVDGFLTTPGKVQELEDRISQLLSDRDLTSRMRHAARDKAIAQFSLEQMTERTEAIFLKAMKRR